MNYRHLDCLITVIALAVVACSGGSVEPEIDSGMDPATPEDAAGPMDAGRPCVIDADCDDGINCTRDRCDEEEHYCRNSVDLAVCDDGIFCNGTEQCDLRDGCVAGPPETCNDEDVCTIDSCDEGERLCRHAARDFDDDGEADWHCEGGTDCDDRNPARGSTVSEICLDTVDNDCDELTDESECGRPAYDVCEDALGIPATSGTYTMSAEGATSDYTLTCTSAARKDVTLTFELTEPKSIRVAAEGESVTYVALRTDCAVAATETECESGFPGEIRSRSLSPGRYYINIADSFGGELQVDVEFSDPIPAPSNESCATPIDMSAGGSAEGSLVDVVDDLSFSCGSSLTPDLTYTFTTTMEQDVVIAAVADTGETLAFAVRSICDDETTQLRCARGAPAGTRLYRLPAGTYYIVLEGPSYREVDFTLDVRFEDPSDPPPGDTCGDVIPLVLETVTPGTLLDKQDDHEITCGFSNRDAVYSFTLTEARDVTVTTESTAYTYVAVRPDSMCTSEAAELRCVYGAPSRARLRDLGAGTYNVIVEAYTAAAFDLTVATSPPTPVVPVTGNETCVTGHVVPESGGLFSGDTTTMLDDFSSTCGAAGMSSDAVFRLDLTARQVVTATTEGSAFDTVLYLHQSACVSLGEIECDDDDGEGLTSMITRTLDPGTYYFVVDGRGTGRVGNYMFEVIVNDP